MRMKSPGMAAALGALLMLAGSCALAQFGGGARRVTLTAKPPASIAAGATGEIVLTLKIEDGYHIQADTAKDPWYATKVTVSAPKGVKDIKFGKAVFPASTPLKVDKETVDVFEGTITVKVPVTPAASAKGAYKLKLALDYQACDEKSCLPPDTITREVTVKVVGSKAR